MAWSARVETSQADAKGNELVEMKVVAAEHLAQELVVIDPEGGEVAVLVRPSDATVVHLSPDYGSVYDGASRGRARMGAFLESHGESLEAGQREAEGRLNEGDLVRVTGRVVEEADASSASEGYREAPTRLVIEATRIEEV